jgi:hypothetical protein
VALLIARWPITCRSCSKSRQSCSPVTFRGRIQNRKNCNLILRLTRCEAILQEKLHDRIAVAMGLTLLYPQPGEFDPRTLSVDIVAVHGLNGHPTKTVRYDYRVSPSLCVSFIGSID